MPWKTFWMESTGRERVGLRRYSPDHKENDWTCAGGYHKALSWLDLEVDVEWSPSGNRVTGMSLDFAADDPRWPATCDECGYVFTDADKRQVWTELLYRRPDNGELRVLHSALTPPDVRTAEVGATWDATWMPEKWRGKDGISLMVRCPRNDLDPAKVGPDWPVDMPSTGSGAYWDRTGDVRRGRVTANPSISIGTPGEPGSYHGWLQNGELSDPL